MLTQPNNHSRSLTQSSNFSSSSSLPLYASDERQEPQQAPPLNRSSRAGRLLHAIRPREFFRGWESVFLGSYFNFLILLVPASWAIHAAFPESHGLIFIFCLLALMPLVKLHDLCIRELSRRIGGSKTGLLNASLSNIIELVVAFSALRKCELRVVQTSLVGSILAKLLLLLGLCFFAGGIRFKEQGFNPTSTQISSSLVFVGVGAVLMPAAYHFSLSGGSDEMGESQRQNILMMSRAVSIILLLIYALYLVFQLFSHSHLYEDLEQKSHKNSMPQMFKHADGSSIFTRTPMFGKASMSSIDLRRIRTQDSRASTVVEPSSESSDSEVKDEPFKPSRVGLGIDADRGLNLPYPAAPYMTDGWRLGSSETLASSLSQEAMSEKNVAMSTVRLVVADESSGGQIAEDVRVSAYSATHSFGETTGYRGERRQVNFCQEQLSEPSKPPRLSWPFTVLVLVSVAICVVVTADWMVEAMDEINGSISKQWIGLILLPAVTATAECVTAVNVSVKDQLQLSISVAVGSTIQTALFVLPLMVTLGWIMSKPMSMLFDPFVSLVLYIAVQTVSYVVGDGKSNWLEGIILIGLYVIVAVSFWFYPEAHSTFLDSLSTCTPSQ